MYAVLIAMTLLMADDATLARFSDVAIDDTFRAYLTSNLLLMEVTGAKVIRLRGGKSVVLSVASTVLKDKSAADRLRAERVCRTKAFAYIVQERKGVQVFHTAESRDKTVIVNVDGKEHGESVSEYLEVTKTKLEGIAKDMPVVGRWKSKDGEVFYMAIGAICDRRGNPERTTAPE